MKNGQFRTAAGGRRLGSMSEGSSQTRIVDLAEFRMRRELRARKGQRRQFLWSWPATGMTVAARFPDAAPGPRSLTLQVR